MSRFEELRMLETERVKRENAFWDSLEDAANKTVRAFREYLELASNTFHGDNGEGRYLEVGTMELGQFKSKTPSFIDGENGKQPFVLRLVVDIAADAFPKRSILIHCETRYDGSSLVVGIEPGNSGAESSITIDSDDDYETAAAAIYEAVRDAIARAYTSHL